MKRLLTADEMRDYEGYLAETLGIPSLLLMERAAGAVCEQVWDLCREYEECSVVIVAGCGNNGADGLAAARQLAEHKEIDLRVVFPLKSERVTEAWEIQRGILEKMGIPISNDLSEILDDDVDVIVDALFGIGLNRPLSGTAEQIIRQINAYRKQNKWCHVVSVDIPSGLHADDGIQMPRAIRADLTVTFGYPKRGMIVRYGRRFCGRVVCRSIGPDCSGSPERDLLMEWDEIRNYRPGRDLLGYKGTFGRVLCIAGSEDMPGAAILNAQSVLGCGAGMVKVIGVPQNRDLMMYALPEAMFVSMDEMDEKVLSRELKWADMVLIGSGLGRERAKAFLESRALQECSCPMVIDADGLNALASEMEFLSDRKERELTTWLTPHPGEFARLFPEEAEDANQDPERVRALAAKYGVILVAKSATTLVSNGDVVYYNSLGSDALAKAGSGDVLAGALAALGCTVYDPLRAAVYADAVHAQAGNLAAKKCGKTGLTASDIMEMLPEALEDRITPEDEDWT